MQRRAFLKRLGLTAGVVASGGLVALASTPAPESQASNKDVERFRENLKRLNERYFAEFMEHKRAYRFVSINPPLRFDIRNGQYVQL